MADYNHYIAPDGREYQSYAAYCNDPDLDTDIIQSMLRSGKRTPQNEVEKELLQEIENAKCQGKYLEYYPE